MKRILLGWELGQGFGYCLQLRQIADALANAGHAPVLALRSLDYAHRLFADRRYPVLQAPWIIGRPSAEAQLYGLVPTSFADLMACNGFGSEDHLYSMLRGWRELIDLVRPDLVVARYSPLLTLAAYRRLPAVVFGPGYTTPPADGPEFPHFRDDIPAYADQHRLLDTVRAVQRRFGAPPPDTLTEIYRGERRVILGLDAFEPYREHRHERCAGIFEQVPAPAPIGSDTVHAYLAGNGPVAWLAVEGLIASGLPGQVHVRDCDPALRARIGGSPLRWLEQPPVAITAAAGAALVMHHGGHGTSHAALAAGRPQLLLPQVLDQWLTARALARTEHADALDAQQATADEVAARLRHLSRDPGAHSGALAIAESIQRDGLHGAWRLVVEASLSLLP